MKRSMTMVLVILLPAVILAQAPPASSQQPPAPAPQAAPPPAPAPRPAAPAATKVAVIHMQRAMMENTDGKKAAEQFMGEMNKRQAEFDKRQKSLDEMQNKLRTQDKALNDAARADLTRQIDQTTTEMTRMNEDAQKELGGLQQQLLRPIADRTNRVLNAYAAEYGFAIVFDISSEANSIIYAQEVIDITTEIIRRVDAEAAKTAKPPEPGGAKKPQ